MKSFRNKVAAITGAGSGIGRALANELTGKGPAARATVSASSVHPGGIKTAIVRSARMDDSMRDLGLGGGGVDTRDALEKAFITTAEKAASVIPQGVQRNRRRTLVGPDARVYDWMVRLLPTVYERVAVSYARRTVK